MVFSYSLPQTSHRAIPSFLDGSARPSGGALEASGLTRLPLEQLAHDPQSTACPAEHSRTQPSGDETVATGAPPADVRGPVEGHTGARPAASSLQQLAGSDGLGCSMASSLGHRRLLPIGIHEWIRSPSIEQTLCRASSPPARRQTVTMS